MLVYLAVECCCYYTNTGDLTITKLAWEDLDINGRPPQFFFKIKKISPLQHPFGYDYKTRTENSELYGVLNISNQDH
jgi:hypothetical protein